MGVAVGLELFPGHLIPRERLQSRHVAAERFGDGRESREPVHHSVQLPDSVDLTQKLDDLTSVLPLVLCHPKSIEPFRRLDQLPAMASRIDFPTEYVIPLN